MILCGALCYTENSATPRQGNAEDRADYGSFLCLSWGGCVWVMFSLNKKKTHRILLDQKAFRFCLYFFWGSFWQIQVVVFLFSGRGGGRHFWSVRSFNCFKKLQRAFESDGLVFSHIVWWLVMFDDFCKKMFWSFSGFSLAELAGGDGLKARGFLF